VLNRADRFSCPIAARRALVRDRVGFVTWLKRVCVEGSTDEKTRGFALAKRLMLLDEIEGELINAIRSDDERLVSNAVLLLGRLKGPGPVAALKYTLQHSSDRVRANAVEAFASSAERSDELRVYMNDGSARVRANAIRHFLKAGDTSAPAESALAEMLGDPRPGHRLSALWAAESAVALSLAGRIDDLSKADPDAQVITRARHCTDSFNRLIRSGWSKPAPTTPTVVTPAAVPRRHVG